MIIGGCIGGLVLVVGIILIDNAKRSQSSTGFSSSTPANPDPYDPKDPRRWNKNSTRVDSKTLYNKNGIRLDIENPSPSTRPGQLHVQTNGYKYIFDNVAKQFFVKGNPNVLAPEAIQALIKDPLFLNKLNYGLEILGLPAI